MGKAPLTPPKPPTSKPKGCRNHPGVLAVWECDACHTRFCNQCIKIKEFGNVRMELCPLCGGRAINLRPQAPKTDPTRLTPQPFTNLIPGAFLYPLRGQGKYILIASFVFLGIVRLLSLLPVVGFMAALFASVLYLAVVGYVIAFLFSVVNASSDGEIELPDLPDFTDWIDDLFRPALKMAGTVLFCFGPAIVYKLIGPLELIYDFTVNRNILFLLLGLGGLLWPMTVLSIALHDSVAGLNPVLILRSIFRIFPSYLVACLFLFIAFALSAFFDLIPIAGPILGFFVGFYFSIVEMRIIGLLYFTQSKKLAWFD